MRVCFTLNGSFVYTLFPLWCAAVFFIDCRKIKFTETMRPTRIFSRPAESRNNIIIYLRRGALTGNERESIKIIYGSDFNQKSPALHRFLCAQIKTTKLKSPCVYKVQKQHHSKLCVYSLWRVLTGAHTLAAWSKSSRRRNWWKAQTRSVSLRMHCVREPSLCF